MLIDNVVTIICPCYNAEQYLERFVKSLYNQTYKNVQVIFVDDGSTDNTYKILKSSKKYFKEFFEILILKKENGGAASAVNLALKYVKGEYLCWADCDDVLHRDNILHKYYFLKNNHEYGLVMSFARAIDYDSDKYLYNLELSSKNQDENIFERLIYPGVPCYPGVFMIRTHLLFNRINNKNIYFDRNVGQNWQLLLPVAYDNKCGYIKEYLYDYYIRKDSHSRKTNYENELIRIQYQENVLINTLSFADNTEFIKEKIVEMCVLRKMMTAYAYNKLGDYYLFLKNIKNKKIKYYIQMIKIIIKKLLRRRK